MKKIFLILSFLLLLLPVEGQILRASGSYNKVQAVVGGAVYTDDFEAYPDGHLAEQGNWILWMADVDVYDWGGEINTRAFGNSFNNISGDIYNDDFEDDQYAEIVIAQVGATGKIGVGVRMSGSEGTADGYIFYADQAECQLIRIDNGVADTLATGGAYIATDVLRLEVSGSVLSCYKNGVLDTSIDTDGHVTDATYSTGKAGIATRHDSTGSAASEWEGGDL